MKKQNPTYFARALLELTRGKKKSEIDTTVRLLVGRFGMSGQFRFLKKIEAALSELIISESGVCTVNASFAQYNEKHVRALITGIEKKIGTKVEVFTKHDSSLIAGAVLTIGDRRIDGSLKNRIHQLKKYLISPR